MSSPTIRKRNSVTSESANGEPIRRHRVITKNEFRERPSKLDSLGHIREQSEYRGFFNLITMGLVFFFVSAQTRKLYLEGTLVGLQSAWYHFTRYDLFPSWLFIVGLSFFAFFIQKLILTRWLPRAITSVLRIVYQCAFFAMGLAIAIERKWPIVQQSFFLLEILILAMKIHSYIMTNREYDSAYEEKLRAKTPTTTNGTGNGADHTGDQGEGRSRVKVQYPQNVTLKNYIDFLMVPTLVYELEYPRTTKIRWGYFLEKLASFMGLWACMHVLVENYIIPVLENSAEMTTLEAITLLIIPFTAGYLIVFYLVFDVACNGFAELTRFADREFYSDWWNSNTWDEFARNWNKPVHEFLLRHVYLEGINTYKMSKTNATLITFLFSSIVHEFFMAFMFHVYRPWLFFFQMAQIPLIYLNRLPMLKNNRFGNHFFWFGMILGPPMITLLYTREYYMPSN